MFDGFGDCRGIVTAMKFYRQFLAIGFAAVSVAAIGHQSDSLKKIEKELGGLRQMSDSDWALPQRALLWRSVSFRPAN